uniref:Peptidase n=1 Tax=Desulfomonile tiedjei TaxID=2358 RepID=A0A7C4ATQ9_9BACT
MTWKRFLGGLCLAATVGIVSPTHAVTVNVTFADSAGEGFFDSTLGAARQAAFMYAMNLWASRLQGTVPVQVQASFDPLGGSASSAVLGQAGFTTVHANFSGAPLPNVWYPQPLANQLHGSDLSTQPDITAVFNSDVDGPVVLGSVGFYYGTDQNPGSDIDFVTIVLHEFGHGYGFVDLIDSNTGQWLSGVPDIYSLQLTQHGVGDFDTMTDAQRLAALTSNQVYFNGPNVVAAKSGDVKIYAPNPYESGSSISHWDPSNTPDLLMEPYYFGAHHDIDLTRQAFLDLGWTVLPPAAVEDWSIY